MKNRTGPDEADSGNDLRGNSGRIGGDASQPLREYGEQGGAETDEQVGAQSCRTMLQFALQPNKAAEKGRDEQANERTGGDTTGHFAVHQFDQVLRVHMGSAFEKIVA